MQSISQDCTRAELSAKPSNQNASRYQYFKQEAISLQTAQLESTSSKRSSFRSVLHILHLQFILNSELLPQQNPYSIKQHRHQGNANSVRGQLGKARRPASPSFPHPRPSPGSDFTSFDISTASKGGMGEQAESRKTSFELCVQGLLSPGPRK